MTIFEFLARALRTGAAFGLFFIAASPTLAASDREIMIDMDYARIVRVPDGAHTLVIGNPMVADVTMIKNSQLMVITGKNFGTTNLIILDNIGSQVGESFITVIPAKDKLVVNRGGHRESYSCRPNCMPTIDLADDPAYFGRVMGAVRAHDTATTK